MHDSSPADHLQVSPEKQDEAFKQLAASIGGSDAESQLRRYLQSTLPLGGGAARHQSASWLNLVSSGSAEEVR